MVDPIKGHRFIFVGGSPRSGTTLVQNMLDSHPDICGGPEFFHIPDIIEVRKKLHQSIAKELIDLFCSYEDVDRLICSLIESLLLPLADKYECKLLSEKTTANVLVFPELIDLFPGARFIHVVRDPRAIVASMLQVGIRAKKVGRPTASFVANTSTAIDYAKKCLNAGFAASKLAPDKVLTVVYERLVTDSERETKRMCDFLKIEWSSQMMHPGSVKHLGEKPIVNEVWYDKKTYYRDPEPGQIYKWKTQLTPIQQVIVAESFREVEGLVKLGYDFSPDDLSPISRILGLAFSFVRKIPMMVRLGRRLRIVVPPPMRKPLEHVGL